MDDAATAGKPLRIPRAVAGGRAERVEVIDGPLAHHRDGLEATVRMLGKAGDHVAVIHAPAVLPFEILPDLASLERGGWPQALVPGRVGVVVVGAEEEWVRRLPGE